jgi:hypothetical protein
VNPTCQHHRNETATYIECSEQNHHRKVEEMTAPTRTETVTDILSRAKELMLAGHRGRFGTHTPKDISGRREYCPLGAIAVAEGHNPEDNAFYTAAYAQTPAKVLLAEAIAAVDPEDQDNVAFYESVIGLVSDKHVTLIHAWNDEQDDDERVFRAMDKAIEMARELDGL